MARITKIELQQINTRLAAENEALRAELSQLRNDSVTQRVEPRSSGNTERRAQLDALKAFAKKFRCLSRIGADGGIELYSKKRGCWVAVPEGAQP